MKLFGFFVAAVTASQEGDRAFADKPDFFTQEKPTYWDHNGGAPARAANLKVQGERYFDLFRTSDNTSAQKRVAKIMNKHYQRTVDELETLSDKCGGKKRTRRAGITWELDLDRPFKKNAEDLFWATAAWARNELYSSCPQQANRMMKRIDRFRQIWFWQMCKKDIDPTGSQCSWISETNPRHNKDHKFQADNNTPFEVAGCQGADAKLICPYGGTIKVSSASFGRKDSWTCNKNAVDSTSKKCWNGDQVWFNAIAASECDGQKDCSISYADDNRCPGVDKYIRVLYSCEE